MATAWREMQPEKPKEPVRRDSWDLAFERASRGSDLQIVVRGLSVALPRGKALPGTRAGAPREHQSIR